MSSFSPVVFLTQNTTMQKNFVPSNGTLPQAEQLHRHDREHLRMILHPLSRIILQQLLDQIDVRHQHAPTTVSLAAQLVHGLAVAHVLLEQLHEAFPEIGYYL